MWNKIKFLQRKERKKIYAILMQDIGFPCKEFTLNFINAVSYRLEQILLQCLSDQLKLTKIKLRKMKNCLSEKFILQKNSVVYREIKK